MGLRKFYQDMLPHIAQSIRIIRIFHIIVRRNGADSFTIIKIKRSGEYRLRGDQQRSEDLQNGSGYWRFRGPSGNKFSICFVKKT